MHTAICVGWHVFTVGVERSANKNKLEMLFNVLNEF